jgi:TetR/AcrR family transcriptional repressor of mexJK operon
MSEPNARPPGRPPGSQGAELLAVARAMFLERGFDRTTMSEVARRAAISKSSLYREHPSKDDLFVAVVVDWTRRGRDAMRPHLDRLADAPDLEQGLHEFAAVLADAIVSPSVADMRRLVASEARRFPEVAATYLETSWQDNISTLATTLAAIAEQGRLNLDDAHTAADQLVWLTTGPSLNEHTLTGDHDRTATDARVASAVSTFLARYGTSPIPQ